MVEKITRGIKISVKTDYNGVRIKYGKDFHVFTYYITIINISKETIQLTDRHWEIIDCLHKKEIVNGPGVVGQTPILKPNDNYTYTSGCVLNSNIGAMKGYYTMSNLETDELFKVYVPTFQLIATPLKN